MLRSKILAGLISAFVFTGLTLSVAGRVALFEGRALDSTRALLDAGVRNLKSNLVQQGRGLPEAAADLAVAGNLAGDFKLLQNAVNSIAPGKKPNGAQQSRLDTFTERLDEEIRSYREGHQSLGGVTLVNDVGVVLLTDSDIFARGKGLLPGAASGKDKKKKKKKEKEEEEEAAEPEENPMDDLMKGDTAWLEAALEGTLGTAQLISDGLIYNVAAVPVELRGKVIGAALVERRLQRLAATPGTLSVLLVDGEVMLGAPPEGFVDKGGEPGKPRLLLQRDSQAQLPGVGDIGFTPLFVESGNIGVWAQRFEVPDTKAYGYVLSDLTPAYGEMGTFQLNVIFTALLAWLAVVGLLVAVGWQTSRGITRMSDFLGNLHQGIGDKRKMRDTRFPVGLRRLVKLINKTVEGASVGAAVSQLPESPSLDDVLQAQEVEQTPDVSDLEFEGITNAGSLSLDNLPEAAVNVPEEESSAVADLADKMFGSEDDGEGQFDEPTTQRPPPPGAFDDADDEEDGAGDFALPSEGGGASTDVTAAPSSDVMAQLRASGAIKDPDSDSVVETELEPDDDEEDSTSFETEDGDGATAVMKITPEMLNELKQVGAEVEAERAAEAAEDAEATDLAVVEEAANEKRRQTDSQPTAVMTVTPDLLAQMKEVEEEAGLDDTGEALLEAEFEPLEEAEPEPEFEAEPDPEPEPAFEAEPEPEPEPEPVLEADPEPAAPGIYDEYDGFGELPEFSAEEAPAAPVGAPAPPPTTPAIADMQDQSTAVMKVTPELLEQLKNVDGDAAEPEPAEPETTAQDVLDSQSTAVMKVSPELLAELKDAGAPKPPAPPPETDPEPVADSGEDAKAAHFKEVFDRFVEVRKECGEPGSLSYEKFAGRLEQTRKTVMDKHKCKDVKFQVYVKAGKAALKATPVR